MNSSILQQNIIYRNFQADDAAGVNAVAFAAFKQYEHDYNNWDVISVGFTTTAELANIGEMIVAEQSGRIVGAVVYVPPDLDKRHARAAYFEAHWAVMRMLVVDPAARGQGIGHALAQACITCAKRDRVKLLALHTSTMMTVAQPMYERMGFKLAKELAPIGGVAYGLYTLAVGGASSGVASE